MTDPHLDWDDYPLWEDHTPYRRTLVVDQRHPRADDGNPGSAEAPLGTIDAAAQRAEPGDRVLIRAGLYRETVRPARGGTGIDAMISYEAAPGEEVVVSGSRVLEAVWERPRCWLERFQDGRTTPSFSHGVWIARLPDELCPGPDHAFARPNVSAAEAQLMPWMTAIADRPPYSLRRGMVFVDGERMRQVAHYGDVAAVPGTFWVDHDDRTLLLNPGGDRDPNDCCIELAVQSHLFRPQEVGLDHIRVAGITFEHCANGFLRASTGAVTTLGGAYWLIEHNTVRQCNSSGIECGFQAYETKDPDPENIRRDRENRGHVIVRGNRIHTCGTAGIRSLGVSEGRVLDNVITDCGWQEAEYYYECAGIKLLVTRHTLVAGNRISGMSGASGIWMDWDNRHSRVTRNLIHDVRCEQGGIFIEASRTPNLIDRNVIWGVDGDGIFGGECQDQLFLHNCIGAVSRSPIRLTRHTDRSLAGQPLLSRDNLIANNLVFADVPCILDDDRHRFAGNCQLVAGSRPALDWVAWQARGFDADGHCAAGEAQLRRYRWRLCWQAATLPTQPPHPAVSCDWYGHPWPATGACGPFAALAAHGCLAL